MYPIERRWVEQTLAPYLRYAFSHVLPLHADISTRIQKAIEYCTKSAPTSTANDLFFERVYLAIEHPHKNLSPDLAWVTNDIDALATLLIRRAQFRGPYELLGGMGIASGAWREYERRRLEEMKGTRGKLVDAHAIAQRPKSAPMDRDIDPRLLNALPGQFASPDMPQILNVETDQYFRHQAWVLKQQQQNIKPVHSWREQLQQATLEQDSTQPPSKRRKLQIPGRRWTYGQELTPRPQPQPASVYVQHPGQQRAPCISAPQIGPGFSSGMMNHPSPHLGYPDFRLQPTAYMHPKGFNNGTNQSQYVFSYPYQNLQDQRQPQLQPLQCKDVNIPMNNRPHGSESHSLHASHTTNLANEQWNDAMRCRTRDTAANLSFSLSKQEKAARILLMHKAQHILDAHTKLQLPQHANMSKRPMSSPAGPVFAGQMQMAVQSVPTRNAAAFPYHPGFSNVRNVFSSRDVMYGMHGVSDGCEFGMNLPWV